ncbi:MAG: tRNA (adenosine(37)-N6)-threonylcarbamoyltransferase complex dimerization subunit type 1 TsaB [Tissierella sp.]|uniref:tRNA (adenosine(37)-N6)-threonylcarbamoyltransferase complex dimerization subunit type 1 TsaB n=1 Tax=Tissierella sp. TaxID=41274 RepID=UPI003F95719A
MITLGLDTSTKVASIAVIDEERIIGEYSLSKDMSHSEKLMPMIKEVLDNIDIKIEDIDLYTVAVGPGSFTGLRIGITTVKSFSHLFNKPIIGVSTLESLAYNLSGSHATIMPILDARRDRIYTALYKFDGPQIIEIEGSQILEIKDLKEKLKSFDNIAVNGAGSIAYKEEIKSQLEDKVYFGSRGQNITRAASIAELGLKKYKEGKRDDPFTLIPEYIRATKAERDLKEKSQ